MQRPRACQYEQLNLISTGGPFSPYWKIANLVLNQYQKTFNTIGNDIGISWYS